MTGEWGGLMLSFIHTFWYFCYCHVPMSFCYSSKYTIDIFIYLLPKNNKKKGLRNNTYINMTCIATGIYIAVLLCWNWADIMFTTSVCQRTLVQRWPLWREGLRTRLQIPGSPADQQGARGSQMRPREFEREALHHEGDDGIVRVNSGTSTVVNLALVFSINGCSY